MVETEKAVSHGVPIFKGGATFPGNGNNVTF